MSWEIKTSWKTQLNILWFGQAILMAMLAMSLPYWPLYIAKLGNFTPKEIRFWSTAIYIAPFVSSIISSPFWGKLGDKYGYKPMVIRACLGLFITQTLILCFADVFLIFIFRFLQGVLAGFIVAAQAWALAISPQTERSATMGKLQSATAVGNLGGPLMGGIIATYGGYHSIFSSSSVICALITILFFFLLQKPEIKQLRVTKTPSNKINNWLLYFQKQVIIVLLVIAIIQVARAMVTPIFALFVTEHLNGNDITVGVLYAATGLMVFVTAPTWGRLFDNLINRGYPIHTTVAFLLFICAGLQVLHAYANTALAIFILRILWGICLGALLPVLQRLLVDNSDGSKNGIFLGLGNSATKFGNLIGIILGALIEANFGYANSFLMTALLYIISGSSIFLLASPLKILTKERAP